MATSCEDEVKIKKQKIQDQLPSNAEGQSKETMDRKLGSENDVKPKLFPAVAMVSVLPINCL